MSDNKGPQDGVPAADVDQFVDPLDNYDPKSYSDPMEAALAESTVSEIQHTPFSVISHDTTIADAIKQMDRLEVACLMVEENNALVGIFADRDVLDRVALEYDQLASQPVSEVMTPQPVYVFEDDSAAAALSVMAISGYRHVPILNSDHEIVGIVSPQRVTKFLFEKSGK